MRYEIGQTFINKWGDVAVIIDFEKGTHTRSRRCIMKFEDHTIISVSSPKIRTGNWVNPNKPTIYGVGFIGQGEFRAAYKNIPSKAYSRWSGILDRCYNKESNNYHLYGGAGVFVGESWHNFQNFARWFYDNCPEHTKAKDIVVDKDLLSGNVKYYSEKTCCLLPVKLNVMLANMGKGVVRKRDNCNTWEIYRQVKGKIERLASSESRLLVEDVLINYEISKIYEMIRVAERNHCNDRIMNGLYALLTPYYKKSEDIRDMIKQEKDLL